MSTQKATSENKTVLITGGGTGIGRATALLFAHKGASVVLSGRREGPLNRVRDKIIEEGGEALTVQGDVTREDCVQNIVQSALDEFKQLDVLVNNAGLAGVPAAVHETTDQMWQQMIQYNLSGAFRMSRAALAHFIDRRNGVIVNVSSIAARVGMKQMAAYSAAKAGVIALTRSIAAEYGHLGIRCNCVCPGTVMSPMTEAYLGDAERYHRAATANPLLRVGRPAEIANAIFYLGSDDSSFLTGAVVNVDGGYTAL